MPPFPCVQEVAHIIHVCRKNRILSHALWLYSCLHTFMLDMHASLGNYLILTLVEVGSMLHARNIFDHMSKPNEHSWNFLITGYMKCDEAQESLALYQRMQEHDTLHPSGHVFVAVLKACGQLNVLEMTCRIHIEIARMTFHEKDVCIDSALLDAYAKCGSLTKAKEVFDAIPVKNLVLYTALITGYVEHGNFEDAIRRYEQMQQEGISPDGVTYVCILKAFGNLKALESAEDVHIEIVKKGLDGDELIGNTVVDTYAKCGLLLKAQEVFDGLQVLTVVSWTALLAGYGEHGFGEEALEHFKQMKFEGIPPDDATFVSILKACSCIQALNEGQNVHAEIVEKGLEKDLIVSSSLIDMYAKCGLLLEAQTISNTLIARNLFTWTALISGYAEKGYGVEAVKCYESMENEGIFCDAAAFICSLKACSSITAIVQGQKIHESIVKKGFETDPVVGNALIDMYYKCGLLEEAELVVEKLSVRTVSSWNTLISAYSEHGYNGEALNCYDRMHCIGVPSDVVTFACILKFCSGMVSVDKGQEIHDKIVKKGFNDDNFLGNTLVDLYAKSGSFNEAQHVFDSLSSHDEISWNSLISVYAQVGESEIVFQTFAKMIDQGMKPNLVSFLSVLNACNHGGHVDKGHLYFEVMQKEYCLNPTLEHNTCIIDLFGRAGHVEMVLSMITNMPCHPTSAAWLAVMTACRKWGNVELGIQAFSHALQLDENNCASYVCMSNIYAL